MTYQIVPFDSDAVCLMREGLPSEDGLCAQIAFGAWEIDDEVARIQVLIIGRIYQDVCEWGCRVTYVSALARTVDDRTDETVDGFRAVTGLSSVHGRLVRLIVDYQYRALCQELRPSPNNQFFRALRRAPFFLTTAT